MWCGMCCEMPNRAFVCFEKSVCSMQQGGQCRLLRLCCALPLGLENETAAVAKPILGQYRKFRVSALQKTAKAAFLMSLYENGVSDGLVRQANQSAEGWVECDAGSKCVSPISATASIFSKSPHGEYAQTGKYMQNRVGRRYPAVSQERLGGGIGKGVSAHRFVGGHDKHRQICQPQIEQKAV